MKSCRIILNQTLRVGFEIHEDRANLRIMSIDAAA
jgi:hypothetical protein